LHFFSEDVEQIKDTIQRIYTDEYSSAYEYKSINPLISRYLDIKSKPHIEHSGEGIMKSFHDSILEKINVEVA
jgi:hypothetical protein